MNNRQSQQGFTAVELLVTLFVAAAFLIAGYQLFSIVIRDGGATRAEADASNVAYEYLREYEKNAFNPCLETTPVDNQPVTVDGLVDVTVTIQISCPASTTAAGLSKIQATVSYNNPAQTVTYATYTNGSGSLNTVTNGLVAWWRLNDTSLSTVGNAHGTPVNLTYDTGQGGLPATAASFNGTTSYIDIPQNTALNVGGTFSVAAWIYPTTLTGRHPVYSARINNGANAFQFEVGTGSNGTNRVAVTGTGVWVHESPNNVITLDTWNHIAYTRPSNASIGTLFVNGTPVGTANSNAFAFSDNTNPKNIGRGWSGAANILYAGQIDDVRLYNRSLSNAEIATIYSGGAQ